MTFTEASIPDLTGKVAVVTGANGGLGLETTKALARRGAHVVMAARNEAKAITAAQRHRDRPPRGVHRDRPTRPGRTGVGAREASVQIVARHHGIDLLVNNAGLMAMPERATVDGFEMQLGVNHLGHWALTAHLMPALLRAEAARVVSVTSTAHHIGRRLDPENPHLHGQLRPVARLRPIQARELSLCDRTPATIRDGPESPPRACSPIPDSPIPICNPTRSTKAAQASSGLSSTSCRRTRG